MDEVVGLIKNCISMNCHIYEMNKDASSGCVRGISGANFK